MQTSGSLSRENAIAHSVVVPPARGGPSIPETLMIETTGPRGQDPPPSRGPTMGGYGRVRVHRSRRRALTPPNIVIKYNYSAQEVI